MTNKILLVEDDKKLSQLIVEYLTQHGFSVAHETQGDKAIYRILHENYFLVILDINLPKLSGLQICKIVRMDYQGIIMMLTARTADEDHITGLEYGADDYITKPIQPNVLLARIKKLSQRKQNSTITSQLLFGKLIIDQEKREVTLNNKKVDLPLSEFNLLLLLATHAGTTLTRDNIMQSLRGIDYDGVDRTIDLRISYLRNKLGDNPTNPYRIKTIRGKGYVFLPDAWEI